MLSRIATTTTRHTTGAGLPVVRRRATATHVTNAAAAAATAMGKDWQSMWAAGLNPGDAFDARRVEPAFENLIASGTLPEGKAFVPGCGRGYAVAALASDQRHVTGLEISTTAKAAADAYLATVDGVADNARVIIVSVFYEIFSVSSPRALFFIFFSTQSLLKPILLRLLPQQDDFFTHAPEAPYDLVYDCTFLCAIDPTRRQEWAAQMNKLVRPGGEIVSLVFPLGDFQGRVRFGHTHHTRLLAS